MSNQEIKNDCFCKSCGLPFLQKEKTIVEIYNGKEYEYSFREEFCESCLWKYVKNVDLIDVKEYSQEEITNPYSRTNILKNS